MKKLLFLALIVVICNCVQINTILAQNLNVQNIKSDLQKSGIKGQVRSCMTETYRLGFNDSKSELLVDTLSYYLWKYTYNRDGFVVEKKGFLSKDNLNYILEYVYNNGNIDSTICFNSEGKQTARNICKYNDNDLCIELRHIENDTSFNRTFYYKYDRNNRKIREITYIEASQYKFNTKMRYDKQDQLIRKIEYQHNSWKKEVTYDYGYDENGNLVEINSYYHHTKSSYKDILEYNNQNNLVKQITYSNGKITEVYLYQYEYDSYNNWVRREQYLVGSEKEILEKVDNNYYEYYE